MKSGAAAVGFASIACGGLSLILVLVHLFTGPLSAGMTLETVVSQGAEAIRDAVVATVKGSTGKPQAPRPLDIDWWIGLAVIVLAALAIVGAVFSFARSEPIRVSAGAIFLGLSAVAFELSGLLAGFVVMLVLLVIGATRINTA